MRLTIDHGSTANGALMQSAAVREAVGRGIDDPSDAIIPALTSLYRVASAVHIDRKAGAFGPNPPGAASRSPWWATNYHFNEAIWASDYVDLSATARATFAIHPAWRSDCRNYASVVTEVDLSVWFGLGKIVHEIDPDTGQLLFAHPSSNVLQIYVPGFADNARRWPAVSSRSRGDAWARPAFVLPFETLSNGLGFQGNMPLGLRSGSV